MSENKSTELKKNLYKNAAITLVAQLLRLALQFLLQRVFIQTFGEEYLGYNSVFKNILQMLNMADLGVGLAITGFLYAPLAEGDNKRVSALMYIFRKVYHIIGAAVIGISSIVMLLLPVIVPDAKCDYSYLRVLFAINVIGTISSYFLAYKRTLLIADQKSYYTSTVDMVADLVGTILQIVFLYTFPGYILYLIINVLKTIVANVVISIECNRKHANFIGEAEHELVQEYKKPLLDYVRDIFVAKIGGYVFSGTDNIIISIFRGSLLAGHLSNYTLVSLGIKAVITQILSAVQATYGRYVVTESDKKKQLEMTDSYIYVDYIVGNVCMITCILLFQEFIPIYVGERFLLSKATSVLVSVNLGLAILLIIPSQVFAVFKLFKYDKYVILVSAVLNIVISAALVVKIGVEGVLIGTTITSLIYLFSRLYIMSKRVFEIEFSHFGGRMGVYTAVSCLTYVILFFLTNKMHPANWIQLAVFAVTVCCLSTLISIVLTFWMEERKIVIEKILPINNKVMIGGVLLIGIIGFAGLVISSKFVPIAYSDGATSIEPSETVELPCISGRDDIQGFTCTGLTYDRCDNTYWIGSYGKFTYEEEYEASRLVQVSGEMSTVMNEINLQEVDSSINNVQGVTIDYSNHTLWFTDCRFVYNIDFDGNLLNKIVFNGYAKPNGLVYDERTDNLWILFLKDYLINSDKFGNILKEKKCNLENQDQLTFSENGNIYFTVGADYFGNNNYIYLYDVLNDDISVEWQLQGSHAVEGLVFLDDILIVANDGIYHNAIDARNILQMYIVK